MFLKQIFCPIFLVHLINHHGAEVLGESLHIEPVPDKNYSSSLLQVDISGLASQNRFNQIKSLHVQLEIGGPKWEFQIQRTTSNKDYFVGMTKSHRAKVSLYRYSVQNLDISHIIGVIQDIENGYWYEIKPNIDGASLVTIIPDHGIAPFGDPVYSSPSTKTQQIKRLRQEEVSSIHHLANGERLPAVSSRMKDFFTETRRLLSMYSPWDLSDYIDDGSTIIDIMVVWTHQAECIKSHLPPDCALSSISRQHMKLSILFFLQETNAVFVNSGLHLRLRLSHAQRVTYVESTFTQALEDLKEGRIPMVHHRRQQYKADMVMLLMDNTGDYPETGVAYNNYEHMDADFMYSVVATQYSSIWYLPAHELGHQFGCSHDRGTVGMCHDTDKTSYGYRDPEGRFRTIMSYPCQARECDQNNQEYNQLYSSKQNGKFQCPIIPYFSSSDGNRRYDGLPVGGAANDCASQIERVQKQVSNFY